MRRLRNAWFNYTDYNFSQKMENDDNSNGEFEKIDGVNDDVESEDEVEKVWNELRRDIDPARIIVVHLTKDYNGFGFNIRGGEDHPHIGADPGIFITTVRAEGAAGRDGRLECGDRILAMNATRLDCVSHESAVNVFRTADESVALLIEKNAEAFMRLAKYPEVEIVEDDSFNTTNNPHSPISMFQTFYHSWLGAITLGVAVGGLVVLLGLKIRAKK